ncbi:hypothetical protein [Allonocardiopsis opalescens]|uniref:Plastocyanin n=1 Tax=Allonocardiopsis opalescens TaxID=1144618 RepID=A0A2T0QEK2_9ACTN|nr:hypothetical protein [Allonocardiopsis opalescens]PRY02374.1 hypothetical protein CLV72_101976 [Allonocardiopsis opalescens]
MKSFSFAAAAFGAAIAMAVIGAGPAGASTGEVIVFTTEAEQLVTHRDLPSGSCHRLPATAHVLVNRSDSDLFIHANPSCMGPGVRVAPDRGWHAPPSGLFSFSVA